MMPRLLYLHQRHIEFSINGPHRPSLNRFKSHISGGKMADRVAVVRVVNVIPEGPRLLVSRERIRIQVQVILHNGAQC